MAESPRKARAAKKPTREQKAEAKQREMLKAELKAELRAELMASISKEDLLLMAQGAAAAAMPAPLYYAPATAGADGGIDVFLGDL